MKILLLLGLLGIAYQDIKERQVYWFLFVLVGLLFGILHYNSTLKELFLTNVLINITFAMFLFCIVFIYAKLKMKTDFNQVFGFGDVLMFLALAFSFANVSFFVVFVFSLFFSMAMHLILKKRQKFNNVPLAGYMSLFFLMVYLAQWTGIIKNLYSI